MFRLIRVTLPVLLAGALIAAGWAARPAQTQEETKPLVIGTRQVFFIRSGDTLNGEEWSVNRRINHVQDVMAKHLGGSQGKITSKKWGQRVHLYLNGDFILAVTPADAQATGYKSAAQLAPVWIAGLEKGFADAHVKPVR